MNDPAQPSADKPRSGGTGSLLAALLAGGVGVGVGAHWHEVFERWLPGHTHEDAPAPGAAATEQLWTCGMHPQVIQDSPGLCPICHMELTPLVVEGSGAAAGGERGAANSSAITIDPAVVQNMGVKTALVGEEQLTRAVRAFGTIEAAEPSSREINLLVSGWIRRLYADTRGMRLGKHAPLFDLYSPELHAAIEESIRLRRSAPSTAPEPASDSGRGSLYAASLRRLELWGLSSAQAVRLSKLPRAPRSVTFTSPIAGVLAEKNVVEGSAVRAGDAVLRVVNLDVVWIEAKLFEQHLSAVSMGQAVTATVSAFPGEAFTGVVVFIDPYVDPVSRTVVVRFAVDNPATRLRPGMFASIELTAVLAPKAIVVPREAVIDTGTRKVALVALGEGRFEPREVQTGLADGEGRIQVLAGLRVGEQVVTSGQFLLDSESRMREAVQKFLRERDDAAPEVSTPAPMVTPSAAPPAPAKPGARPEPTAAGSTPAAEPTIYDCPMHLEIRQPGPGQCPICGMDLVPSERDR